MLFAKKNKNIMFSTVFQIFSNFPFRGVRLIPGAISHVLHTVDSRYNEVDGE
jgi:hypothetical protein